MILDGYTTHARIKHVDEGELRFDYRPMLSLEREYVFRAALNYPVYRADRIAVAALFRHLVEWDMESPLTMGRLLQFKEDSPHLWERMFCVVAGLERPDNATDWSMSREKKDAANLRTGIRLEILNPKLSRTTCKYCQENWFDPIDCTTAERGGKPIPRTDEPLLCQTKEGCPRGTPEKPNALSDKNRLAYRSFLEDRATGLRSADPIVRKNAAIIESVLRRIERERSNRALHELKRKLSNE